MIPSVTDLLSPFLCRSNFSVSWLSRASLSPPFLFRSVLSLPNLSRANLSLAYLSRAYLSGANLSGAYLIRANFKNVKNLHYSILPEGDIIGYKKLSGGKICKLLITKEAKRVSTPVGRKCRAKYAKVLEIQDGRKRPKTGRSQHDSKFIYKVGEIVKPDKYDDDFRVECSEGIHFFITLKEAKEW